VEILVAFANSIVQAAGSDLYKESRRLLGQSLGRFGGRKGLEKKLDITRERLRSNANHQAGEAERWIEELQKLLTAHPSAEAEFYSLHGDLLRLLSGNTRQSGSVGRDQYNIAGGATFIKYKAR
jgi:hypothetical protein